MDSLLLDLLDKTENRFKKYKKTHTFNWNKVTADCQPGDKIKIIWKKNQFDDTDVGYIIALPGMQVDEGDVFVHIPNPSKQNQPKWCHLYDLLSNDLVEKIKAKK